VKPETELTDVDVRNHDEFFKRLFNNAVSAFSIFSVSCIACQQAWQTSHQQAGFSRMEILPIEIFFFRFYRLWP
jgi:hypothetical protein